MNTCKAEGCSKDGIKIGYCQSHYMRWRKHGDPLAGRPTPSPPKNPRALKAAKLCSLPGCNSKSRSRGFCHAHYSKWWTYGDPTFSKMKTSKRGDLAKWIDDHVGYEGDDCLTWPFGRYACGAAKARAGRPTRIICEKRHGPPPTPEHMAAHSCGNGHLACMNPKHLRWATRLENEQDKLLHGRIPRGEAHPCAILTEQAVKKIRRTAAANIPALSQLEMAELFGVNPGTIGKVIKNKTWRHVNG